MIGTQPVDLSAAAHRSIDRESFWLETTEYEDRAGSHCIHNIGDLAVGEHRVEELCNLESVGSDLGFVGWRNQSSSCRDGVPISPHAESPNTSQRTKIAPDTVVFTKLAPPRYAPVKSALLQSAPYRLARLIFASTKTADISFASIKVVLWQSAPERSAS